eukprot:Tamp_24648.p5 GENE.Tamp_24648~~Tamp_24648.p5  ORF type:complete len:112 (+),score=23.95 Tamp_24648:507-842(+)
MQNHALHLASLAAEDEWMCERDRALEEAASSRAGTGELQRKLDTASLAQASLQDSVSPVVKLALALARFGGNQKNGTDKNKLAVRGDPYVLVVGEPGLHRSCHYSGWTMLA